MSQSVVVELELPADMERFRLPAGVDDRLRELLDRQDRGEQLSSRERSEAEAQASLPLGRGGLDRIDADRACDGRSAATELSADTRDPRGRIVDRSSPAAVERISGADHALWSCSASR